MIQNQKYFDLILSFMFALSVILEYFGNQYYALLRIIFFVGLFFSLRYKSNTLDLYKSSALKLIHTILFFISCILYVVIIIRSYII